MDSPKRRSPLRSFALGGLLAAGTIATARRLKNPTRRPREAPAGLAAFEDAPCFRELAKDSHEAALPVD